MAEWFFSLHPAVQALLAALGTWGATAVGASLVILFPGVPRRVLDALLGFAGGVMVAASCWSLLVPALDLAGVIPAVLGLLAGAAFLFGLDRVLPHLHPGNTGREGAEGLTVGWRRAVLLVVAITLHNIPEGLAVGVAYGGEDVWSATALAVGIGLQNMPEGLAVAFPLRREGVGALRALWWGQLSAVVEPVAALLGAILVNAARPILPYGLAFAAGAMLYVVVEDLIPEAERSGNIDLATIGFIIGFATMMALDNALG
jgi:ZIP family zinc transporter